METQGNLTPPKHYFIVMYSNKNKLNDNTDREI